MTLQVVQPRAERRQQTDGERDERPVLTGEDFRRQILGWSKAKFYAWKKAGEFNHLVATHISTRTRTFYNRAACLAWAGERPSLKQR